MCVHANKLIPRCVKLLELKVGANAVLKSAGQSYIEKITPDLYKHMDMYNFNGTEHGIEMLR